MKWFSCGLLVGTTLLLQNGLLYAKEVTPLQLLFTVKQAFPESREVSIMVTTDNMATAGESIKRAVASTQLKAKIYVIASSADIGSALGKVPEKSILVIFNSGILTDKKSKLFVLSKCKPKQIAIITSSKDYSESGALLGIVKEADETRMVLNLKHNQKYSAQFSDAVITKLGIQEVIR